MLTHRSSGVVNLAHAAMGMYVAYAFFEFRETGDWVLPILGLPARVHLIPRPTLFTALLFAVVLAAGLGLVVYGLVFRPLRESPPLARLVASLGLLIYIQEMVRLRFPVSGASAVVEGLRPAMGSMTMMASPARIDATAQLSAACRSGEMPSSSAPFSLPAAARVARP